MNFLASTSVFSESSLIACSTNVTNLKSESRCCYLVGHGRHAPYPKCHGTSWYKYSRKAQTVSGPPLNPIFIGANCDSFVQCRSHTLERNEKLRPKRVTSLPVHTQKNLFEWGELEKADASNLERNLLSLPVELMTEILNYFPAIGPSAIYYRRYYHIYAALPEIYLARMDMLRALSTIDTFFCHFSGSHSTFVLCEAVRSRRWTSANIPAML